MPISHAIGIARGHRSQISRPMMGEPRGWSGIPPASVLDRETSRPRPVTIRSVLRYALPLLVVLPACASTDMQAQLNQARLERDQARLEAEQARVQAEKAMLEAERIKLAAEKQLAAGTNCETAPEPTPTPVPDKTTVVQGKFKFSGKATVVQMHVAGMGIDESFNSNRKGQIAIELPVGTYQVSIKAKGYRDKVITLDVPARAEGQRFEFSEKLERKK